VSSERMTAVSETSETLPLTMMLRPPPTFYGHHQAPTFISLIMLRKSPSAVVARTQSLPQSRRRSPRNATRTSLLPPRQTFSPFRRRVSCNSSEERSTRRATAPAPARRSS
jgi:hypothetical protein